MNRRDHYTPRGYLSGFVHPNGKGRPRPLWVFDVAHARWSEKSASQVGWERGFYDYPPDSEPDATADEAFMRLENDFPLARDEIRAEGFETWNRHRDVLVSFAAMLAARSRLFRVQSVAQVLPSLSNDANGPVLAKNYAITTMRSEMTRRAAEWGKYHWALGYTTNPEHPFVTSDQAVGMRGGLEEDQAAAYARNDFWLCCSLSWDLCLIGSSQALTSGTSMQLQPTHISEVQQLTLRQAAVFFVSPVKLQGLTG